MVANLLLSLVLLLQAVPQVNWKSEVRQDADGNKIVLTGELEEGIDHVSGTVTYMPCRGDACYMPVDWDFEEFLDESSADGAVDPGNVSLRETPPTAEGGGSLPIEDGGISPEPPAASSPFPTLSPPKSRGRPVR